MSALVQSLEAEITDALTSYQQDGRRQDVKDALLDLVNPNEGPYLAISQALARMDNAHNEIRAAIAAGKTYPWISPRLAAMAFEGIFECCVGAWLAAGEPQDPVRLKPGVQQFINWQMQLFGATLGAR
jgi:hypothetical protein